jgi:hypothetical protein
MTSAAIVVVRIIDTHESDTMTLEMQIPTTIPPGGECTADFKVNHEPSCWDEVV